LLGGTCGSVGDREQIDMSLYQRARDILAAKVNKALDAAEKPDEMLDLSYEDMLDQITQVRRALVDLSASRKHIELQKQQFQHSVEHLDEQAKTALGQGDEELAREALSRKATAQAQISDLQSQQQDLDEQEQKLEQTLATLQKRVNDFRSQKEVIKAQYVTAQAETSVEGIPVGSDDSGESLQRALDKIATTRARAGATDELLQSGVLEDVGGDTDDFQDELDEAGKAAEVDKQLAALKAQIGQGSATPELPGGH
jgi:phage shock protein A